MLQNFVGCTHTRTAKVAEPHTVFSFTNTLEFELLCGSAKGICEFSPLAMLLTGSMAFDLVNSITEDVTCVAAILRSVVRDGEKGIWGLRGLHGSPQPRGEDALREGIDG